MYNLVNGGRKCTADHFGPFRIEAWAQNQITRGEPGKGIQVFNVQAGLHLG
jgi:hypothetical protein